MIKSDMKMIMEYGNLIIGLLVLQQHRTSIYRYYRNYGGSHSRATFSTSISAQQLLIKNGFRASIGLTVGVVQEWQYLLPTTGKPGSSQLSL